MCRFFYIFNNRAGAGNNALATMKPIGNKNTMKPLFLHSQQKDEFISFLKGMGTIVLALAGLTLINLLFKHNPSSIRLYFVWFFTPISIVAIASIWFYLRTKSSEYLRLALIAIIFLVQIVSNTVV